MGSTVNVFLPAAEPSAATSSEPEAPEEVAGHETILVCEDDPAIRQLTELLLREVGYRVLTARNGEDALNLVANHDGEIHMLVTDVIMPRMDGGKLAERLSADLPGLRVMFISGYTANVIAHHGVLEDGVEFLEKPFTRDRLLQRVRQVLDK
jgi:CheY-like chemotaxis protein